MTIIAGVTTACSNDEADSEHCAAGAACPATTTAKASLSVVANAPTSTALAPPPTTFCESAAAVLNQTMSVENYEESWVLSQLRSIDTSDLATADSASFADSLNSAEHMIRLNGPDGWTTKGVADASSRLCGTSMNSWNVTP